MADTLVQPEQEQNAGFVSFVSSNWWETKRLTWGANSTIELKDNTVIIVLGASGDLAKKKTVSLIQFARLNEYVLTQHDSSQLCSAS